MTTPWKDRTFTNAPPLTLIEKPLFTMFGQCHRRPYKQDFDTLHDAVCCAAAAIDLNAWHPEEVRNLDGEVVMGKDELWERAQSI